MEDLKIEDSTSEYDKSNLLLDSVRTAARSLGISYDAFIIALLNAYVQASVANLVSKELTLQQAEKMIEFIYTEFETEEMSMLATDKTLVN